MGTAVHKIGTAIGILFMAMVRGVLAIAVIGGGLALIMYLAAVIDDHKRASAAGSAPPATAPTAEADDPIGDPYRYGASYANLYVAVEGVSPSASECHGLLDALIDEDAMYRQVDRSLFVAGCSA